MKKVMAVLLSLALLLGCAAVAETAEKEEIGKVGSVDIYGAFSLKCRIPEGYRFVIEDQDTTGLSAKLASEEAGKPEVFLTIAFNEEWAGVERLNDATEEDMEAIRESFLEVDDGLVFEERETAYGTKLLVVRKLDEEGNITFEDVYTNYKGYEIEFVMYPAEGTFLTEENTGMMVDFLGGMDFVPVN